MATRIIINGDEVTNPLSKVLLILGMVLITSLITAAVIFFLLPAIGIVVTLSVGFVLIIIFSAIVSFVALALSTLVSAWLFGTSEFRIERIHDRRYWD